ncbi:hypothetical protein H6P81_012783 [Aristolochia fimbriata]|uniref:Uncharacterized protein n=1 Tax=Aristolochia fimbriata TaxID=158543 RepID=A0AAV7ECS0_ARIFI|nr:hypothetical protein H6P81_012783 [Aristolochia fimbriata]
MAKKKREIGMGRKSVRQPCDHLRGRGPLRTILHGRKINGSIQAVNHALIARSPNHQPDFGACLLSAKDTSSTIL